MKGRHTKMQNYVEADLLLLLLMLLLWSCLFIIHLVVVNKCLSEASEGFH